MDELSQQQITTLKKELELLKKDLESQMDRAAESAATVTLDQTLVGRVSRMDAMQQQSVALSTRALTAQKLRRIDAALDAIDVGDYGFCRHCDEVIGFSRLRAQPESSLCIRCQDRADNQ